MSCKDEPNCPIRFALDLFGDKWTLLILRDVLFFQKKYYQDFLDSDERISTNILANRLQNLEAEGFLNKDQDPTNKKKFIYSPTEKSLDLLPFLMEMVFWSVKYDDNTAAPPHVISYMKRDPEGYIRNVRAQFKKEK